MSRVDERRDTNRAQVAVALVVCAVGGIGWYWLPHPALLLGVGLAPLALIGVMRVPFLVCLAFIIFSFFRIHEAFPVLTPLHIPQALAISAILALLWHFFVTGKIQPFWTRELSWFALFFGLVTVGVIFASNRGVAMSAWSDTFVKMAIMVLAIAWLLRTEEDFALASRLFVIAGILIGGLALYNKVNGIGLIEGTRVTIGRDVRSILGDPNDLSLVLLFPASFSFALMIGARLKKIDRLLGLVGYIVVVLAIVATQSRGGLLGVMAVSGLLFYRRVKSPILLLSVGAIALSGLLVAAGISDRASGGAAEDGIDESAMGRIYAWKAAFYMAVDRPLSGVGLNNFLVNYFAYSPHWDGKNHAVHSTWFGVLGETGFPGLIVFVTMVFFVFRSIRSSVIKLEKHSEKVPPRVQAMASGVYAGLLGFIVSGTFLTQGFTWPIYVLLALTVAASRFVSQLEKNAECNAK